MYLHTIYIYTLYTSMQLVDFAVSYVGIWEVFLSFEGLGTFWV